MTRVFMNIFGVGLSLIGLTACGILSSSSQKKDRTYGLGYVTNARLKAQRMAMLQPELRQGMALYANCELLSADLNASVEQRWIQQKANISDFIASTLMQKDSHGGQTSTAEVLDSAQTPTASGQSAPNSTSTGTSETMTNVQEAGVDEADRYRIGRDQIYAYSFGQIQIINRASLQPEGSLDVSAWYSPQFYTKDDRLIIVGPIAQSPEQVPAEKAKGGPITDGLPAQLRSLPVHAYGLGGQVKVAIYRTAAGQLPSLISESQVEGRYLDSRLVQNQLVLVIGDQLAMETVPVTLDDFADEAWHADSLARHHFANFWAGSKRESFVKITGEDLNGIPCSSYVKRKMADWDIGVSKVVTLDTANPLRPAHAMGIIGQGGEIYMSTDSLYLLKTQIQWFDESWGGWNWFAQADEKLLIQQIGFDGATGALQPLADGEVRGRIKNRWALQGLNSGKHLAIATTTGSLWGTGENIAQNHLFILEQDAASQRLNVVGSVENYGSNEDIRSVRYVGNTAYIVTFRQTDPLFAIDIADPKAPKMLGDLKIPGFSTYMHPLASGRLLGVGFDAFANGQVQGVQVSLFDTSDPTLMSRLDVKTYGSAGSASEVTHDHHAFFFDSASGLIGVPLIELFSYGKIKFSGAQLFFFDGQNLVDRGRVTHRDMIPSYCLSQMVYGGQSLDINRLYRVDDRLITLSPYGMKAFGLTDFTAPSASLAFKVPVGECQPNQPIAL